MHFENRNVQCVTQLETFEGTTFLVSREFTGTDVTLKRGTRDQSHHRRMRVDDVNVLRRSTGRFDKRHVTESRLV